MDSSEIVRINAPAYPVLADGKRIGTWLSEALAGEPLSLQDLDRIKVPAAGGQFWQYQTAGEDVSARALRGVIVHQPLIRLYWSEPYGEGETKPPDCLSKEGLVGVGAPGGECAVCPMAQWESKGGGSRGQACQQRRLLFLLLPGEYLPRVISAPPTSLFAAKKYILGLVGQGTRHPRVVTEIGLSQAKTTGGIPYSVLTFRAVGHLTEGEAAKAEVYGRHLAAVLAGAPPDAFVEQGEEAP